MIQYAVNSTAYLLKNVPIDRGYEHSYRFTSPTEQNDWMLGANHAPVRFDNLTYIREHNSILLEGSPEDYMDYNYIAYVNESYDPSTVYSSRDMRYTESANTRRRWIYGFISSVQYYSNNVVEIFFAVDVLQTFYFDFEFGKCFVEREHSASDEIGENIVPEPVSYEDYCCVTEDTVGFDSVGFNDNKTYWLAGVILSRPISGEKRSDFDNHTMTVLADSQMANFEISIETPTPDFGPGRDTILTTIPLTLGARPVANIPTSLFWYMDIPVDVNPNDYPDPSTEVIPATTKYTQYGFNNHLYKKYAEPTGLQYERFNVLDFVHWIASGIVPTFGTGKLNENDIAAVFIYPASFTSIETGTTQYNTRGIRSKIKNFTPAEIFKSAIDNSSYAPINQKLLCYPYRYLECTSNMGSSIKYKFEDFKSSIWDYKKTIRPKFTYLMCATANPVGVLIPVDYKQKELDYDSSVLIGDMPQPSYQGSKLGEYITTNRGQMISTAVQTAASAIGNMFGYHSTISSSASGLAERVISRDANSGWSVKNRQKAASSMASSSNFTSEVSSTDVISIFNKVVNAVGRTTDIANTPPTIYGNAAITDLRAGTGRFAPVLREMSINCTLAKRIDDFFTMFGYATNAVKKPGIYNRYRYQYIKLGQAVIHPNSYALISNRTGMNAEVEERLSAIFSKGITLWNKDFDIGDYPDGEANPVCTGVVVAVKQSTSNEVRDHFDVTIGYGGRTITIPGSDAAITVDRQYLNPGSTPTIVHISINGYTFEQTFN